MPSQARVHALVGALKTYNEQRRNSFAVETEIRKLCAFHDSKHRSSASVTISRLDWDLLVEGRSHLAHTGYCGGHKLVINGMPQ